MTLLWKNTLILLLLSVVLTHAINVQIVLQNGYEGYNGCEDATIAYSGMVPTPENYEIWGEPDLNYDSIPYLHANFCPPCSDFYIQSVINFNIPDSLSSETTLKSATLELKIAEAGIYVPQNRCILYPLTKPWKENEVTFNSADKDTPWEYSFTSFAGKSVIGGGNIDTAFRVTSSEHTIKDTWVAFDVTEIIKETLNKPEKFHGFLVAEGLVFEGMQAGKDHGYDTAGSFNNMRFYYSSEYETVENRPKLTLEFEGDAIIQSNYLALQTFSAIRGSNYLRIENNSENNYSVDLFEIKGRIVQNIENVSAMQSVTINTSHLAKGVYILHVYNEMEVHSQSIVIE